MDTPTPEEILAALRQDKNVLLYGPPGCGKTYLMTEVRRLLGSGGGAGVSLDKTKSKDFFVKGKAMSWWVTFHQAYSYEDFVVGLRTQEGGNFSLTAYPGPILEASAYSEETGAETLVLIDELNRGNTGRVFGEMITLIEDDKRSGKSAEVTVNLPAIPKAGLKTSIEVDAKTKFNVVIPQRFRLSPNVYILASMNSVDRTVAPLDAALRRRFRVIELGPDMEGLAKRLQLTEPPAKVVQGGAKETVAYWKALGILVVEALNRRIMALAGRDFLLGHGYLKKLVDANSESASRIALAEAMNHFVVPQVEELFRDNSEALAAVLRADGAPANYPIRVVSIDEGLAELGGARAVQAGRWSSDATLADHLLRLAGS